MSLYSTSTLGFGTSALDRVHHTGRIIRSLIDGENGPYVAVVWTDRPDDFDLFQQELRTLPCPPVLTVKLEKGSVLSLSREERADAILQAVDNAVAGAPSLEFANLWEQIVRDAANDTLVSLALAEAPEGPDPKALAFLAALLKSEANKRALEDDASSMSALLAALNPLHFDKVQARSAGMGPGDAAVVAPLRASARSGESALSQVEQAQFNASLLFDQHARGFGPGHLYSFDEVQVLGIGAALPGEQDVRRDTVEPDHLERAGELPVVFLEVSAACDHQQGKIQTARLLAGVVFPAATFKRGEKKKRLHSHGGDYLRTVEPMRIPGVVGFPAEDTCIAWNAHYPVAVPVSEMAKSTPIGRFREPLLADIRAWLGYQAGRPGYASIG